ncbi:MAG: hypothetical protein M3R02_12350 [Chloroflexota bacterium]|nr:hypothetical protein [Chloroflexota bacterium]
MSIEAGAKVTASTDLETHNIRLSIDFLRQIGNDPGILDGIPDGVTLILLTGTDPVLDAANVEMGLAQVRAGKDVLFRLLPVSARAFSAPPA